MENGVICIAGVLGGVGVGLAEPAQAADNVLCVNGDRGLCSDNRAVIVNTATGTASPAKPAVFLDLTKREILGYRTDADLSSVASKDVDCNVGVLCVSERHDAFNHHVVQLRCIQTLKKALRESHQLQAVLRETSENEKEYRPTIAIGMEMFRRQDQAYLDRYVADKVYGLEDLMRDTHYNEEWGYDILHYVPVLTYAKEKHLRLVGLNAPSEIIQAVQDRGLNVLYGEPSVSGLLPSGGVDCSNKRNWKRFQERFSREDIGTPVARAAVKTGCPEGYEMLSAGLARAYEGQCTRDDYMAESVAQYVGDYGGWMVVLAGSNHIEYRDGLPDKIATRVTKALRKNQISIGQDRGGGAASASHRLAASASHSGRAGDPSFTFRGVHTVVPRSVVFPVQARDYPTRSFADYVWFVEQDAGFFENGVNQAPSRLNYQASTSKTRRNEREMTSA